ncbi:MAG: cyclodeaminase/cyclohydrolase family protein [Eggerthellaceae bacterium]|jgi:formiminotetrahydrofolate cyclodeaminase|nr:cyclodeaminase/cyclohydrolase family protein [Eggerthellaceae bacterium]MDR2721982.1 cyclodeaminase/cyclohydrolase family protein [Coriobacteriaceae bacterium]
MSFELKENANFTDLTCEGFIEELASKAPVPGGGGAAALVGALGVALGNMVGSLTVGKEKYASVEAEIIALKTRADALQTELLGLVQQDAEVFEPLSRAYGLPKNTEEEKAEKQHVMEACLRECCEVPLSIMRACGEAIDLHVQFARIGTPLAISDVGCGVACCKAALQAASLNVFINTKAMQDRVYAHDINARAHALLDTYTVLADDVFVDVTARFE